MKNKGILFCVLFVTLFSNFNTSNAWLFDNPETWNYSVNLNPDDHLNIYLRLMPLQQNNFFLPGQGAKVGHSMADMNGDGLSDLLLHIQTTYSNTNTGYNTFRYSAILYNKGDYTFGIGYRCAEQYGNDTRATVPVGFYGDCAE